MYTKIMKWVAIAALLGAVAWRSSASYQILLQFAVCAGAILVMVQAGVAGKYLWAVVFIAIGVLFNPIAPVALSSRTFLLLDLACLAMFLVSLTALKTETACQGSSISVL
jgi:hypothetical protein